MSPSWGLLNPSDAGILTDLKKTDFSIQVKSRCLLQPKAAEALIQVQKTFQITGEGLVMKSCYIPRAPYCTGGTVWVDLVNREEVSVLGQRAVQFQREMKRVGFEVLDSQRGKFTFQEAKNWPCLSVSLDQIP